MRLMLTNFITATPQGPQKFAIILSKLDRLRALDRYEQRALSRRKFAIRETFGTSKRRNSFGV
jgi:hypothetical protein